MSSHMNSPPMDNDSASRKRVCKACDRCRLKKSKCDGSAPCSRCRSDNAICVFGERKKSHDKVYPKGYVEMLEQQQTQLVTGLQELYRRSASSDTWKGTVLQDFGGCRPLTHDILESLGVLKQHSHSDPGSFEDDLETMQQKLVSGGASYEQQQDSPETESDDSPIQTSPTRIAFFDPEPLKPFFIDPFGIPTPPVQSPRPRSMDSKYTDNRLAIETSQPLYATSQKLTSMNPGFLQHRQTWVASPTTSIYDDIMDYQPYDSTNLMNIKLEQQQRPFLVGEGLDNWREEDFNNFIQPLA